MRQPPQARRNPQTYEEWMSELQAATTVDDDPVTRLPGIITAAAMISKLSSDKKQARHDTALILAIKYREEMARANGRAMLIRPIEEKYDKIAEIIFKSKFKSLLNYVIKNEPNFDIRATNIAQGKTPPGFIRANVTYDKNNEARAPLGFMTRPSHINDEGKEEPGLGFLDDGSVNRGGLGFL